MDIFNISRLVSLLLITGMVAVVFTAKQSPEPQDMNVVNTPDVTVTNPQTSVSVDNTSSKPVPVARSITVNNSSTTPVNVNNHAGGCSKYQTPFLVAECTALKNTLLLRIFLKLG